MEAKIRNKSGESTLTIKGDFYQILDENFKEICKAITNKVKSLKEMKALLDADDQILNTIVLIAAHYLFNMPLFTLVSLTAEGIEKELSDYRNEMEAISSLCQHEVEY